MVFKCQHIQEFRNLRHYKDFKESIMDPLLQTKQGLSVKCRPKYNEETPQAFRWIHSGLILNGKKNKNASTATFSSTLYKLDVTWFEWPWNYLREAGYLSTFLRAQTDLAWHDHTKMGSRVVAKNRVHPARLKIWQIGDGIGTCETASLTSRKVKPCSMAAGLENEAARPRPQYSPADFETGNLLILAHRQSHMRKGFLWST